MSGCHEDNLKVITNLKISDFAQNPTDMLTVLVTLSHCCEIC